MEELEALRNENQHLVERCNALEQLARAERALRKLTSESLTTDKPDKLKALKGKVRRWQNSCKANGVEI